MDRVADLSNKRDEIIHATYAKSNDGCFDFTVFDFKQPKTVYINTVKRTIPTILLWGNMIEELATDIHLFYVRLRENVGL